MLDKLRASVVLISIVFGASLGLAACDREEGPMEEAGEAIDDTVDDIEDATN